jgi:hypothetical protein
VHQLFDGDLFNGGVSALAIGTKGLVMTKMSGWTLRRWMITSCALLGLAIAAPASISAQEIDFSRIGSFESMGAGTVRSGAPPKTMVSDDEPHAVFLTIWNSDTDAKVYWKALDSDKEQTTVIHGTGVRAFQTNGEFKIQALGDGDHEVKYDYVLVHLRKQ